MTYPIARGVRPPPLHRSRYFLNRYLPGLLSLVAALCCLVNPTACPGMDLEIERWCDQ
jgi:hypothetical protein